ncbi:hypothetical protein PIB30_018795 [Stylosanthes scabra]|uniref:Sulfotransferase n=1 Tax=Stylosanthes scabra TaxID=79078 RepID=A0ABU6R8B4_9FABA|nr:hypothetical protein [Stylosanthes scabra]
MFLRYEQMKLHPTMALKELGEFIGCPFSKQELDNGMVDDILKLCSFDNLSNLEVNKPGTMSMVGGLPVENKSFFRRGKIGDSNNFLTPEMVEKINNITEKKLSQHAVRF